MLDKYTYWVPREIIVYALESPLTVGDFSRGFSLRKIFTTQPEIHCTSYRAGSMLDDTAHVEIDLPPYASWFNPQTSQFHSNKIIQPYGMQEFLSNLNKIEKDGEEKVWFIPVISFEGTRLEFYETAASNLQERLKLVRADGLLIPPDFFKLECMPTEIPMEFWGG